MATGKVIETLRRHLARNEIEEAVSLYETCVQQSVGQELWQEFTTASKPTKKAIANLFYRSRDYQRAGQACEQLGEWTAAAKAYGAAHEWAKAAACAQKTGDRLRAAEMYQKGGELRRAAELYYEAERFSEAAEALELAGDLVGAGQLFVRANQAQRAIQALGRVTAQDARFMPAVGLLADLLVQVERRDLAIHRLAAVAPLGRPVRDASHAELAYRLGLLMAEEGQYDRARQAFEQVFTFDPQYRDVTARLDTIRRYAMGGRPPTPSSDLPRVVAGRPLPPREPTDPFAALAGSPFAQPVASSASTTDEDPLVERMAGYDVLKRLPIFEDLSLDEMKAFYTICERTTFQPNEVVIEQGQRGAALYIVREGRLRVTRIRDGGSESHLATVPAGQYVGEMSLIDDAPTSARVSAAETVKALRVTKNRFDQLMFANEQVALRVYRSFLRTLSRRLRAQNIKR